MSMTLKFCTVLLFATTAHAKPIHASRDPAAEEPPITTVEREHWSFKPLARPALPIIKRTTSVRNEVDRFILAKLEAEKSSLSPQADAATLIRRVTFDLIGLPPTVEEVKAFIADSSDQAYEALVDRLLKSPHFGEQQARHWLDLARFAESDGFEHDIERKHAWKYRDWVIDALNRDLPYDEFVRLQLAGDELSAHDAIATGFLVAGPDMPDLNNQTLRRHDVLNEITGTVGAAFFGLTVSCAQCHDHAYDPISQADFYRLRAVFDNLPPLARDRQLGPAFAEAGNASPISHVSVRGDYLRAAPTTVTASFPRIATSKATSFQPTPTDKTTGRRAAFARWLTQPDNVLLLRSTVNRLWMHHFGLPIAGQPNDLGHQGEAPTHPELLDWLATELPARHWSLKAMHKLIVMSATYRQGACRTEHGVSEGSLLHAPSSMLYASFPRRRISGEELRDAMLLVSGRLNLKAGGESVRLPLPTEVSSQLLKKQQKVTENKAEHDRRSIYTFARRNLRQPIFELFDKPDALVSCGRRSESTTAPQALTLFNSEFSSDIAHSLAKEVLKSGTDATSVVNAASWRSFARAPTDQELAMGKAFIEHQTAITRTLDEAVSDYCLALLNASAFLFVD
jgi:hypothetical protein